MPDHRLSPRPSVFFRWCLLGLALVASQLASAMDISVEGPRIFVTGVLELTDEPRMAIAMSQGKPQELVLVNVSGANFSTALSIAVLVEQKRLNTTVAGQCLGACAVVFLAGRERRFAEGEHPRRTLVGLQLPVSVAEQPKVMQFLERRLPAGAPRNTLLAAVQANASTGGLVRIPDPGRNTQQDAIASGCPSADSAGSACQALEGSTAVTLGMVTSAETAKNVVPPDLLAPAAFFGADVRASTPQFEQKLLALAQAMCGQDGQCNARFSAALPRLQAQKAYRAAALGRTSKGFGFSENQETPDLAAKRAVFLCNHTPGNKKLCQIASVNDVDLSDLYGQSAGQSASAKAAMSQPLTAEAWAGEDRSTVVDPVSAELRTAQLNAPTPLQVAGLSVWRTGALAAALAGGRLTAIDVHGPAAEMLPGAIHFWEGGLAFEAQSVDQAFNERFLDMLGLVAPNKDAQIVFYCQDANCWTAVNAALRARRAGYAGAGWYRGGLRSWKAAGLPVVQKVPGAVLN